MEPDNGGNPVLHILLWLAIILNIGAAVFNLLIGTTFRLHWRYWFERWRLAESKCAIIAIANISKTYVSTIGVEEIMGIDAESWRDFSIHDAKSWQHDRIRKSVNSAKDRADRADVLWKLVLEDLEVSQGKK